MTEKNQNGMSCSQFEALLFDVLEQAQAQADAGAAADASGLSISVELKIAFEAHAAACPACGPMSAEVREGMLWLRHLDEVQPPGNLVHNILAATSALKADKEPAKPKASQFDWLRRMWLPIRRPLAVAVQPRVVTSFSMAFFSLSLTLTLAGVKLKDLARMDWRPSAVGKAVVLQYTQVESKVVRYYNNMRLVYEIQSRVDDLRKNSGEGRKNENPPQDQPQEDKKKRNNNDTSGWPEQRQDNQSREPDPTVLAYIQISNEGA